MATDHAEKNMGIEPGLEHSDSNQDDIKPGSDDEFEVFKKTGHGVDFPYCQLAASVDCLPQDPFRNWSAFDTSSHVLAWSGAGCNSDSRLWSDEHLRWDGAG